MTAFFSKTISRSADNFAWWTAFLFLTTFLCPTVVLGHTTQDTLVIFKKQNPDKEYKIPLKQYNIKVRCRGHKNFNGLLIGYTDSSLVFKTRHHLNKTTRRQIKEIGIRAIRIRDSLKFTYKQWDSLMVIVQNDQNEIYYPTILTLKSSELKKINIDKHDRPEKKKQMLYLETTMVVILAGMGVAVAADSPEIGLATAGPSIIWDVTYVVMKKQRIRFKKWKIKSERSR